MSFTTKLLDILSINATAAKDYIDKLLETKQNKLTFDDAPKKGSTNPVTSDGIRKAIDTATPNVDFSNYPTKNGTGATGTWPISISGAATKASQDSNGKVIADTYETKADFKVFLDNCSEELIESYWETPQKFVFNKNDNMGPINLRVKDTTYVLNGYGATNNKLFDIERDSDCMCMCIDYDSTVTPAITADLFKCGSLFNPDGVLYAFFEYHQIKLIKESNNAYILWSSPYSISTGGRAVIEWPKDYISAASPNCTYDNIRAAYMNGENLIIEFIPK